MRCALDERRLYQTELVVPLSQKDSVSPCSSVAPTVVAPIVPRPSSPGPASAALAYAGRSLPGRGLIATVRLIGGRVGAHGAILLALASALAGCSSSRPASSTDASASGGSSRFLGAALPAGV